MALQGGLAPRAERSGSFRIADVEIGDLRQAIASIAGVATLARAQSVGPRALSELLPELATACRAVPDVVARALLPSCDVIALATARPTEARDAATAIVAASRDAVAPVLGAIAECGSRNPGAKSRIALQRACESAVDSLARARAAIELLQRASLGEPVSVCIEELLQDLETADVGAPVVVHVNGAIDATVTVQPRVAGSLMTGLLSLHVARHGAGPVSLSVGRLPNAVTLELRPAEALHPGSTIRTRVHDPAPYDVGAMHLAAASLAATIELDSDTTRLTFLAD